jgi:hypothetical protein
MPDIYDVMDVTMDDLSPEQQIQWKDAIDQFQQIPRLLRRNKRLWMLFGKLWKA